MGRGLPSTIAIRGFQTFALFGLDAFVPHLVHDVRGYSLGTAGSVVTVGVFTWTAGSWIQERLHDRLRPDVLIRIGLLLNGIGGVGLIASAFPSVPIAFGFVAFGCVGLGMGTGYSAVSVVMLAQAEPGREGAASASLSVTDVLFTAVATGIGGACIRLADAQHWTARSGLVLAYCAPVVVAFAGVIAASRLRDRTGPSERPFARSNSNVRT